MLTIATVPKPFKNPHINIIQRNAIESWLRLRPAPEIILFGNSEGVGEIAKELGVLHVPEVESEFGIPLLNSVFNLAQKMSKNQLVAYINTDIILMNDFMEALRLIKISSFLMAGRRWDINIKEPIQFNEADWEQKLEHLAKKEGKLHGLAGMDYFVFPRNSLLNIPSFIAGRPGYDSWLLYNARTSAIPVINATEAIMVLHQSHSYSHRPGGEKGILKEDQGKRNINLAGGLDCLLTLRDANWILTPEGLKKPSFSRWIFSTLSLFKPWRKIIAIKRRIQNLI